MMEGMHVLAQGRRQIHRLDEAQVLPPRVAEHIAEQVDAAAAFAREVDVVDAIIHLRLLTGAGLKARHRQPARAAAATTAGADARSCSRRRSRGLQFLQGALDGEVRIAAEQFPARSARTDR